MNTSSLRGLTLLATLCGIAAGLPAAAQQTSAAAEYNQLAASEDVSGADWLALAERAREAGDLTTARRALDLAEAEVSPTLAGLERARLGVAGGEPGAAVAALEALYDSGFAGVRLLQADSVLAGLAGRSDYDALIERMSRRAFPCRYDDAFHEFDFWLGDWDVHLADGQYAGRNRIRRDESGCVLTEQWVSAQGGTGSSVNFVDKRSGEWVQVWNSENGTQISIRGGLTEDGMLLRGTIHYVASGSTAEFRGLWTPLEDGRVRQFFEQSNDGGETWAPWFEGFYTASNRDDRE